MLTARWYRLEGRAMRRMMPWERMFPRIDPPSPRARATRGENGGRHPSGEFRAQARTAPMAVTWTPEGSRANASLPCSPSLSTRASAVAAGRTIARQPDRHAAVRSLAAAITTSLTSSAPEVPQTTLDIMLQRTCIAGRLATFLSESSKYCAPCSMDGSLSVVSSSTWRAFSGSLGTETAHPASSSARSEEKPSTR